MIAGRILILLIVAIGVLKSGTPASYTNAYGLLLILVGGAALLMVSFRGAEIWRAFRHAAGSHGSDADIENSAHFWEAAGRNFWILGGLSSVLTLIIGFINMSSVQFTSLSAIVPILIRPLLSIFYGALLAVICFVPCWKLMGKHQNDLSESNTESNDMPTSFGQSGWRLGAVLGYILFLFVFFTTSHVLLNRSGLGPVFWPPLLVVLGGTLALMLFKGRNNSRLTPSAAFGGMGLIGSLVGFIQMLIGMTDPGPQGIGKVAGALAFVLFSCLIALLGMALIGAPLEDRAVKIGQTSALSAFSRVSWYVFPLLSLIFLVLVFNMIILPLPAAG